MAIATSNAVGSKLTGTPQITALPLTIACWFYATNDEGALPYLMDISAATNDRIALVVNENAAPDTLQSFIFNSGGAVQVNATTGISYDTWHHGVSTFWETAGPISNMEVYLDGGNNASDNIGGSHAAFTAAALGGPSVGGGIEFTGSMAEFGVWDVVLINGEIAALAAGYSPLLVRPQNLVHYIQLFDKSSPSIDLMQSGTWTWVNSPTVQNHPPGIIYPSQTIYGIPSGAAPPQIVGPFPTHFRVP